PSPVSRMRSDLRESFVQPQTSPATSAPPTPLSLPANPDRPAPPADNPPKTSPCPLVGASPAAALAATVPAARWYAPSSPPVSLRLILLPVPQRASVFHPVPRTPLPPGPQIAAHQLRLSPICSAPPPANSSHSASPPATHPVASCARIRKTPRFFSANTLPRSPARLA